jgi:hypothetical protein
MRRSRGLGDVYKRQALLDEVRLTTFYSTLTPIKSHLTPKLVDKQSRFLMMKK